jgi:predicted DNA-binding transcriptional regulator AlpA
MATLLSISQVSEKIALCPRAIYKLVAAGAFPAPRKATEKSIRWVDADVDRWILNLPAAGAEPRPDESNKKRRQLSDADERAQLEARGQSRLID